MLVFISKYIDVILDTSCHDIWNYFSAITFMKYILQYISVINYYYKDI